jgi:hypothetical protein
VGLEEAAMSAGIERTGDEPSSDELTVEESDIASEQPLGRDHAEGDQTWIWDDDQGRWWLAS